MKPVLIGMNNPLSSMDGHQLYPHPDGCTGHRIYEMLRERLPDVRRGQYLTAFDRRNLVTGQSFSKVLAKQEADRMYAEFWGTKRTVVLLGEEVRRAFGHPRLLVEPQMIGGCTWRQIPHPSGRNLWFNDPAHRKLVGLLLEELYENYRRGTDGTDAARGADGAGARDHDW